MKISIITVVFNAQQTIGDAIKSVAEQTYPDIEHIIVDGGSTDNTMQEVNRHADRTTTVVSEPDEGIYDAMNKGIALSSGRVIGLLNADDVLQDPTVVQQVADAHQDPDLDACYADLVYVKANDISKVTRYWRSQTYRAGLCFGGWMPAHPTFYLKKRVYDSIGLYDTSLRYQSDLEFCARAFEVHNISSRYIPKLWVRMRLGGVTNNSLRTIIAGNWESYKALKKLGLRANPVTYFATKFANRIPQFFKTS